MLTHREAGASMPAGKTRGCRARLYSASIVRSSNLAGTRLRVRLKHQQALVGQSLGRFRLSVTSSTAPQRVVEITAKLRPVLAVAPVDRTEQQTKDLSTLYRNVATSLKPVRERLAALQKELKALDIPTAMVMRERNVHERPSAYVRRRGSFLDRGEKVYADVPATLHRARERPDAESSRAGALDRR